MELDEARERFLVQVQADGRSVHTLHQYARHLALFARWARRGAVYRDVASIGHEDLARFLTAPVALCRPDGARKKPTSVNALRASLRGFFGYCTRAQWVARDPSRVLRNARCSPPPPKAMTEGQIERLRAAMDTATSDAEIRDRALFTLLIDTGVRLSSAVGLDCEDIDAESGQATIQAKGGHTEIVFLNTQIQGLLMDLAGERHGPVFLSATGRRISARQVQRRFSMWLKRADVRGRFSCHSARHSFATNLYQKTGDVLLVKEALGHRSLTSTMIYARADRERVRAAVAG